MTDPSSPRLSEVSEADEDGAPSEREIGAVLAAESFRKPFGPLYFLTQLRAFVRDCCPAPEDGLPFVELHLVDGTTLDLCHVVGVAPQWVALAVNDEELADGVRRMRTEFVPYATILRVTIRPARVESPGIGFFQEGRPQVLGSSAQDSPTAAETALSAAAGAQPRD